MKRKISMNRIILTLLPLLIAVLICGCSTSPATTIVWDETLSESETVTIHWLAAGVQPKEYNGINVDWKMKVTGFSQLNTLVIPAGVANFVLTGKQYDRSYGGSFTYTSVYDWEGISFTYNFEKGKEYSVWPNFQQINIYNGRSFTSDAFIEGIKIDWSNR